MGKSSKIEFISSDILQKVATQTPTKVATAKEKPGIRFMDEEYPDLATTAAKKVRPAVVLSREARDGDGRLMVSDAESNSEWETEEDSKLSEEESKISESQEEAGHPGCEDAERHD